MEALMTNRVAGKFGRLALWLSPVVFVVITLLIALPWVRQQNPALARLVGEVGVIFVACYGIFIVLRQQRRMDEVHLASQGFANSYGWLWGGVATTLLLMVPPVMNRLVDLVNAMAKARGGGSPDMSNHLAVQLAFFYGISLVMVIQGLGVCVASVVWWRRMGGFGAKA
jgi:hypothetical protein